MGEVANRQAAFHAPARGNRGERLEHEAAPLELRVGDLQAACAERAAAPQGDVEVEHARAPAAAAPTPEIAFDRLEPDEQDRRIEIAFDERNGIGEIAPGAALRRVEDDGRGVEQLELLVQPGDCRLDHPRRPTEAAVRAVGADGDGVEVRRFRQQSPFGLSLSKP